MNDYGHIASRAQHPEAMIQMNPANNLVGQTIMGVWNVEEAINLKENGSTGGNFCIPYRVRNTTTGQKAFLKVLDVVKAIQRYASDGHDVLYTLNRVTSAHLFEAQLMEACNEKRLKRVVRALASGEIGLEVVPWGQIGFPFLIFELADGDTHKILQTAAALDLAWWFGTLHQAAVGIQQLHGIDIAHQDVKPSNVVFFGVDNAKLADLGRAARKGVESLNDERVGDGRYLPPEYYYGYIPTDWTERFLAMDLYLLGSLAFSGISQLPMTGALFSRLPPSFHFRNFHGNYGDVVPALVKALADVLEQTRPLLPESLRDIFTTTVAQLCQPDPSRRGHPKNHEMVGSKYSIERHVSAFHRMAIIAGMELK